MTSTMPTTTTKKGTSSARRAKPAEKDLVARLADAGEEAIQRLADLPGGQRAVNAVHELRVRVDDLAKKVRGIDALEARVAKLEKELAALKRPKSAARRTSTRKPAS
jgi:hypothetical protein